MEHIKSNVGLYVILGIVLLLGVVSGIVITTQHSDEGSETKKDDPVPGGEDASRSIEVELACTNEYAMRATYSEPDARGVMQKLTLTVTQGEVATLHVMTPARSGSGSRFETSDGVYALWEHQDEFRYLVNDVDTAVCHRVDLSQDTGAVGDVSEDGLTGRVWVFADAATPEGGVFRPKVAGAFTVRFEADGTVAMGTDCNNASGEYTLSGDLLAVKNIASTMMYCEGSEESSFLSLITSVERYTLEGDTLRLILAGGSGEMRFR